MVLFTLVPLFRCYLSFWIFHEVLGNALVPSPKKVAHNLGLLE